MTMTVSEEEVEAAAKALLELTPAMVTWEKLFKEYQQGWRRKAPAALEAAAKVREGKRLRETVTPVTQAEDSSR